jgi:hypothetical protein
MPAHRLPLLGDNLPKPDLGSFLDGHGGGAERARLLERAAIASRWRFLVGIVATERPRYVTSARTTFVLLEWPVTVARSIALVD